MRVPAWILILAAVTIVAGPVTLYFSATIVQCPLPVLVEPPGGEYAMPPWGNLVILASGRVIAVGVNDTLYLECAPVAPLVAVRGGLPDGSAIVIGSVAVGNRSGAVYALYAVTARDCATGGNYTVWACYAMQPVRLDGKVALVPAPVGPGGIGETAEACEWLARVSGVRWDGLVWSGAVSVEDTMCAGYATVLLSAAMLARNGSTVLLPLVSESVRVNPGRYAYLALPWAGSDWAAARDVIAIAARAAGRPLKIEVRAVR